MVAPHVNAWISDREADPSQRCALAFSRELATSHFGIICLTEENLQSPWILYEAGAMVRSLKAGVVPLLFGVKPDDMKGPLAQFQCIEVNGAGIERLVSDLYDSGKSALHARQKHLVFSLLWPILDERLHDLVEQTMHGRRIQCTADILDDLAKPLEKLLAVASADDGILGCIVKERARLRRELEYLETEQAKLSKRDAPISLVVRAIMPTRRRLEEVEVAVDRLLEQMFSRLSLSQIALLRSLAAPSDTARVLLSKDQATHRDDLKALERMGIVTVGERGAMIVQDLGAEYAPKRFGNA